MTYLHVVIPKLLPLDPVEFVALLVLDVVYDVVAVGLELYFLVHYYYLRYPCHLLK